MLPLQIGSAAAAAAETAATTIGRPNAVAMAFFFGFIAVTLGITAWAARRTRTADEFYAAGRRVSAGRTGSRWRATT